LPEGALCRLDQRGDRRGAAIFLVACLGFGELRAGDRIVRHRIPHHFCEAMRLDASVAVHGQRMAMDLYCVAVDQHVALNQG
jgi:hypothetical protein